MGAGWFPGRRCAAIAYPILTIVLRGHAYSGTDFKVFYGFAAELRLDSDPYRGAFVNPPFWATLVIPLTRRLRWLRSLIQSAIGLVLMVPSATRSPSR
ncbi:MAG: hypothetical protein ACRENY_02535, partial [Candidatus Dormibacteria bacterium]